MAKYARAGRRRRWLRNGLIVLIVAIGLLFVAAAVVRAHYEQQLRPVSNSAATVTITVESGATTQDVAASLFAKRLIRAPWAFEWYVRINGARDSLQAGTYAFSPNLSVAQMVSKMSDGDIAKDLFTILPAQRLDQVRAAFIKGGYTEAEIDAALNPAQYSKHPALVDKPSQASLEGYLYPDSFQKIAGTTANSIVKQSLDEMQEQLTPDIRAAFTRQGLTTHQAVTIASMVEQEVSNTNDRPIVAQVFLKRLKDGMMLGSDVTAFYGAAIAGREPTVFYDSPYNTRIYTGLPPGPISNVSATSLKAVAYPASTSYVFFVAGDDGTTHFSNTLKEHEALVAKYCKKLCQ